MKADVAILSVLLVAAGSVAHAYIPPGPMPEVGWNGPGHLCEAEFTLKVEPGEFAREDIQLEPSQPASNTIKSANGWFTISTLIVKPDRPARSAVTRQDRNGVLYALPEDEFVAAFLFLPAAKGRPALKVTFPKNSRPSSATSGTPEPQKSREQSNYASVLGRLTFARTSPPDCINL